YTTPFALSGDGTHTVTYTVVDVAGNSTSGTYTVNIDTGAPTANPTYSGTAGTNGWYITTGNVSLAPADATSGVASTTYRVDAGAAQTYTAPFALSGDGTHTIAYTVVDKAGLSFT